VVAQPDEAAADARIRPLDPDALAPPPPGLRFDGNAYEIHAVYRSARTPVVLRRPVPIILRYATGATQVLRFSGATWTPVTSTDFPAALTRTFDAPTLGVFVTAAPAELPYVHRTPLWMYAGVGTAVLGILALVVWSIRTGRVRRRSDPAVRKRRG
jgi:hypothetical protein